MKLFKQVTLVAALAAGGNTAFALESLDDSALSKATGQDGITVEISTPNGITIDELYVHDKDGRGTASTPLNGLTGNSGAIVLGRNGDFSLATSGITLSIDADGGNANFIGTDGASLNVNASLSATTITTGEIGVADSARSGSYADNSASGRGLNDATNTYNKIMDSMTISLDGGELNVQLGGQYQAGATINMSGTITNGLSISNFKLEDTSGDLAGTNGAYGGGALSIGKITISDSGASNLTLDSKIDITTKGLRINSAGMGNLDVFLDDIRLGDVANATTSTVGDVEIKGLNADSVVYIRGH